MKKLIRLKPFLTEETRKRNENLCIFYDYDTCKTEYKLYKEATRLENEEKGYIVMVSYMKPLEHRVDTIMDDCVANNRDPTDAEIDEMCNWVVSVKKEIEND